MSRAPGLDPGDAPVDGCTSTGSTRAMKRYPRRATVLMNCGDFGSSPSASRSSDTACASALSVTLAPGHNASSSASFSYQVACVIDEMEKEVEQLRGKGTILPSLVAR